MDQGFDLQVGDRCTADVRHTHADDDRVDEIAHHQVLAELGVVLGVPEIHVHWVVVHGEQTEEVVVALGDGLAGPMAIDVPHLEVFEIPSERTLMYGHA